MKDNFRIELRSEPSYRLGDPISLTFELTNTSDHDFRVLTWDTPLEKQDAQEVFQYFKVRRGDLLVPYDGRFVKRGDPDPSSYVFVRAGESAVETVDLTTAFPITDPGTYTVTLDSRVLDVITLDRDAPDARTRDEHRGFDLDPLTVTFEVVADGVARTTIAESLRRELGPPLDPTAVRSGLAKLAPLDPVLIGGTATQQWDVRAAHENAGAFAEASMRELDWTTGALNALSTEWFGTFDSGRYTTVRQHYSDSGSVIAGQQLTYDLTGSGCQPGWYAYTYKGTRKVWLCSGFWSAGATGTDSKFGTLVHELSHAVSSTDDLAYGQTNARNLANTKPADAIRNADNHEYFAEGLSDLLVTAPVVWNNGKAYLFTAGRYYRYDIAADKVDPGYPLAIAGAWPGLFPDRVDAGVVWNNGKAYFFRGSQYMRYDIAADHVDPGYPLPIAGYWPGLWPADLTGGGVWPNGKAYFFRGSQYMRYDIAADRVDPGYPLPVNPYWPGLP